MKIDENRRQVYVTTYGNNAVAIIDTNTDQYLDSKTFGPGIWGMAVNPNLNYVYLGLRDANRVKTLYDPAAHEIARGGHRGCAVQHGVQPRQQQAVHRLLAAPQREHRRVFATSVNGLVRIAFTPIGDGGEDQAAA